MREGGGGGRRGEGGGGEGELEGGGTEGETSESDLLRSPFL